MIFFKSSYGVFISFKTFLEVFENYYNHL